MMLSATKPKRPTRRPEDRAAEYQRWRIKAGLPRYVRPTAEEKAEKARVRRRNWYRKRHGIPLGAPLRDDQGRPSEYYRARYTANEMKRIAAKKQRTPQWLNVAHHAEIEGAYHFAKVMERITGRKYHVDHIEPLQGADVSGLHVPWNLQVIPDRENFAKGNRRVETCG